MLWSLPRVNTTITFRAGGINIPFGITKLKFYFNVKICLYLKKQQQQHHNMSDIIARSYEHNVKWSENPVFWKILIQCVNKTVIVEPI